MADTTIRWHSGVPASPDVSPALSQPRLGGRHRYMIWRVVSAPGTNMTLNNKSPGIPSETGWPNRIWPKQFLPRLMWRLLFSGEKRVMFCRFCINSGGDEMPPRRRWSDSSGRRAHTQIGLHIIALFIRMLRLVHTIPRGSLPRHISLQDTLNECWFNVGPASSTPDQH